MRLLATLVISLLGLGPLAAASVGVVGGVTAIGGPGGVTGDVRSQGFGTAEFFSSSPAASNLMAADGLTILTGTDPGPITGSAGSPSIVDAGGFNGFLFPGPDGQSGDFLAGNTVLGVDPQVNVTQFGLTFSRNGVQHITAYDRAGALIGQLRYSPEGESNFVGIDTGGTPIGWLAVSNDDLAGGASLGSFGPTPLTDDWMWNYSAVPEPEEWALMILGAGAMLFWWWRRRRPVPVPA